MKAHALGLLALWAGPLVAGTFVTGTYVYVGTALDYDGTALGSDDNVIVQAVSTNGTVLAESTVYDLTPCGMNYRLSIPLSNQPTNLCACTGDALRCIVRRDGKVFLAAGAGGLPPVGNANSATNCTLVLATDTDGDGVPDQYVSELQADLDARSIAAYDAKADYDGDGSSNYAEYLAGTNPFDATDYLHPLAVGPTNTAAAAGLFAVSFEYVGGHVYAVNSATNLLSAPWARRAFRLSPDSSAETERVTPPLGEIGTKTLYFVPAADAEFFKVLVNPSDPSDCQ